MFQRFSIVTPSFNQGRFVERTIQSVLDQKISDLEYVIIDGGSNDETLDILRRYEGRLTWISEKDRGQADAVNKGLSITKGEIIGWLNSDDIYYTGALSTVLSFFKKYPEIAVLYGDADHIDVEDRVIEPYWTEDWDYERLKEICYICQPAVFFRRRIIEKAGLLDTRLQYCLDYEYWLRLGAITPFTRISKRLAGSRMYPENKTLGSHIAVHREINDMFQERWKAVAPKWIFAYAHAVVEQKGYNRLNPKENLIFVWKLLIVTITSSLRWRPTSFFQIIKSIIQWGLGSLTTLFKK